jgi:hypothetical protein
MRRRGEAGDVTDLGHEHGGQDRPHAVDDLDRPVALMVAQHLGDAPVQIVDLAVVDVDQVPQGVEAGHVGVGEVEGVELGGAAEPEHVHPRRQYAVLAHHRMDLGLESGTEPNELQPLCRGPDYAEGRGDGRCLSWSAGRAGGTGSA